MLSCPRMGTAVGLTESKGGTKHRFVLLVFVALLTLLYTVEHVRVLANHRSAWDFETFYLVGHMVRHGDAARLYDISAQAAYQMRYVDSSRSVTAPDLAFFYPAVVALGFLPLTFFSLPAAFAIFTACNLICLIAAIRLLQRHLAIPQNDRPIFAALLFLPVYACLLHGQLSILMLFLYTAAFAAWKRGNLLLAGLMLGLGTLKFQLVLGFLTVMLLRGFWKFLAGAVAGGSLVAAGSAAVVGWREAIRYPLIVTHSASDPHLDFSAAMISLRGMLGGALGHDPQGWLVAVLSIALLAGIAIWWREMEVGFSMAMLAAILVSYHAYLQELTLLLLPLAVIVSRLRNDKLVWSVAIAMVVIPSVTVFRSVQLAAAITIAGVAFGLWYVSSNPGPRLSDADL